MIDLRHPLAVLSTHMPWQEIEASLAGVIARKVKAGRKVEDIDLFGPVVQVSGGGISNAGRPRLPMRLMVSPLYLKHTYNLSDEELVAAFFVPLFCPFAQELHALFESLKQIAARLQTNHVNHQPRIA